MPLIRGRLGLVAVPLLLLAIDPVAAADCNLSDEAQAGKKVAQQCLTCHEFKANQPSGKLAPNIHDVFGASMGTRKDYRAYSPAMQGATQKGLKWTEDGLIEYLKSPSDYLAKINGRELPHGMFYQLRDSQARHDVVAFLKAIKGHPECN